MARANRHHLPGYVWHITHRCHKREFLLKFDKDKKRWIHWLYEAKKRFGLIILNFTITSNHIHLLVYNGDLEKLFRLEVFKMLKAGGKSIGILFCNISFYALLYPITEKLLSRLIARLRWKAPISMVKPK